MRLRILNVVCSFHFIKGLETKWIKSAEKQTKELRVFWFFKMANKLDNWFKQKQFKWASSQLVSGMFREKWLAMKGGGY